MSSLPKFIHLQDLLLRFFDPIEILDYMPQEFGIYKESGSKIRQEANRESRVCLFIETLEERQADDPHIMKEFSDALETHSSCAWLVPLLNDSDECTTFTELILNVKENEKLRNILNVIYPALKVIKVDELLRYLPSTFSRDEREEISNMANRSNSHALFGLMLRIITKKHDWIFWFITACRELKYQPSSMFEDANYETLADALDDFIGYLQEDTVMETEQTITGSPERMNEKLSEQMSSGDIHAIPFKRKLADIESELCDTTDNESYVKKEELDHLMTNDGDENSSSGKQEWKMRNYQEELCEQAILGENVIICAPTGSGKTLVAAHIIKTRINNESSPDDFKVAFFTPTAGLTNQQHQKLKDYLPDLKIAVACGNIDGTNLDLKREIFASDIIVLTPQILVNALEEKSVNSVFTFSMMIFDECHHACKGHPYNHILYKYLTTRKMDEENSLQIIGLTATLGIGKTAKLDKAIDHIMSLCGSLDCLGGIITVKKYCDDLHRVCPDAAEETIPVATNEDQPFKKHLIATEVKIGNVLDDLEVEKHIGEAKPDFKATSTEQLDQWCSTLRRKAGTLQDKKGSDIGRNIISCADTLKSVVDACDIYNYCQPVDAIGMLEKSLANFKEKQEKNTEVERTLHSIILDAVAALTECSTDPNCSNENLQKIEEKILGKLDEEPDSRIMVMVPKRLFTQALKKWMNGVHRLADLNCEVFIGVGSKSGSDISGLTHSEQTKIMQRFNAGDIRVLICTPEAAGEGLDIEMCNLVINYNYMRNEISSVQTKGRARQKNSQVIQLSSEKVWSKDKLNLDKILLMERATSKIQRRYKQDPAGYRKEVTNCQFNTVAALRTSLMKRQGKNLQSGQVYKVCCRKCNTHVCHSNEIQRVNGNQYTIFGDAFKDKYDQSEHPNKYSKCGNPDVEKLYKIQCFDCKLDWGIISRWKGVVELPAVKVKAFKFINGVKPILSSKWKNAPFTPEEADLAKVCKEMNLEIM